MTETKTREVPLGIILTGTTGALVCDFGEFHEFVEWMAEEPVWTHQLLRVGPEVETALLAQHPALSEVVKPEFGFTDDTTDEEREEGVKRWVETQETIFGKTLTVRSGLSGHESREPLGELAEMMGRRTDG